MQSNDNRLLQTETETWLKASRAAAVLGVSVNGLRHWANTGRIRHIRTPGGMRLYDVGSLVEPQASTIINNRVHLAYCRVSSSKQRADLERQATYLRDQCQAQGKENTQVIKDIGSGLNFKRRGLRTLLERCFKGEVRSVTVACRDRLCRFGFELLEWLIRDKCKVDLVVLQANDGQRTTSPEHELSQDILAILHVFSSRVCGLRRYDRKGQGNEGRGRGGKTTERGQRSSGCQGGEEHDHA